MLTVYVMGLLVNSMLLAVKFLASQKLHGNIQLHGVGGGVSTFNPCIFQGSTVLEKCE